MAAQYKIAIGLVRLNGRRVEKASARVRPGDMMTLAVGSEVLVVRVLDLGMRRGPAAEARGLYELIGEQRAA
jgi:ribosome-associated heat shock protein Hsp15